jgi:hypothetical protein
VTEVFLELVLVDVPDSGAGVAPRHDLEDALSVAFGDLAVVSGGGAGVGASNVDIEVRDEESVAAVVDAVRRVCQLHGYAGRGRVLQRMPDRREWSV